MASTSDLSGTALLTICKGGRVEKPLLQVLGLKKIGQRWRMYVSDGQYSNSFSMLATQMNDKVGPGGIETMAVIRADNYICNDLQDRKVRRNNDYLPFGLPAHYLFDFSPCSFQVIILLDVEVVKTAAEVGSKIGNPVQISAEGNVSLTS